MKILILLGNNREYLTYKIFSTNRELDLFIHKIHPLIIANINGVLPLKTRLEIVKDDYFHLAGSVHDIEVIDLDDL
jgi:hypothetical protein